MKGSLIHIPCFSALSFDFLAGRSPSPSALHRPPPLCVADPAVLTTTATGPPPFFHCFAKKEEGKKKKKKKKGPVPLIPSVSLLPLLSLQDTWTLLEFHPYIFHGSRLTLQTDREPSPVPGWPIILITPALVE